MVWYERYSMFHVCPFLALAVADADSDIEAEIEFLFDAYGDFNGIVYRGRRMIKLSIAIVKFLRDVPSTERFPPQQYSTCLESRDMENNLVN